eukprot:COSAG03_NODE_20192_length_323_cov_0.691964_1_plen_39_part_01
MQSFAAESMEATASAEGIPHWTVFTIPACGSLTRSAHKS